jgi:hypothetical protein
MKAWSGWVIGRKMYGDDNEVHNYTYYPKEKGGRPPYLYPTKAHALRALKHPKNSWLTHEANMIVFKFSKNAYLDRY